MKVSLENGDWFSDLYISSTCKKKENKSLDLKTKIAKC